MLKQEYVWKFPLSDYEQKSGQRQDDVQHMLDDLRKQRDNEKQSKKQKQQMMVLANRP